MSDIDSSRKTADTKRHRRVVIFSASVGDGHNAAARELARRLHERGIQVECYDWLDTIPYTIKTMFSQGYRPLINHFPWLFTLIIVFSGTNFASLLLLLVTRWYSEYNLLRRTSGADVVVSTYGPASQCLGYLRERGLLKVPVVSYLCDAGAQRVLFHRAVDLHLAPIAETAADCNRYGFKAQTVDPLVAPSFGKRLSPKKRAEIRKGFGIAADARVILVTAGSLGIGRIAETVLAIPETESIRTVVLCGKNEALRGNLKRMDRDWVVLGWRRDLPDIFGMADLLVQSAGGMQTWEGMVSNLPMLTFLPLPGHGQQNAKILHQSRIAPWVKNPAELRNAISSILDGHRDWSALVHRSHTEMDATDWVVSLIQR